MSEFSSIVQPHPLSDINTLAWVRSSHRTSREAEYHLLTQVLDVSYPAGCLDAADNNSSQDKIKVAIGWIKAGADRYINTLYKPSLDGSKVLLINHGYGGGLGIYFKNYQELLSLEGWKVYSIDWMGMGNSSRPSWIKTDNSTSELDYAKQAEAFFVDSLEEWRIQNNIQKMTILGHSLGGYLSVCN